MSEAQTATDVTSFAKAMVLGEIHEELVFPFPLPDEAEAEKVRGLIGAFGEYAADHIDSREIDEKRWIEGAQRRQLEVFFDGILVAEAEKATAAANANKPKPVAPTGRGGGGGGSVGGACGGASNGADRYIARESGGNPNARNASGAWGCYQIMPGTWSSSCSDLGPHGSASTEAQAACASRLPQSSWGG